VPKIQMNIDDILQKFDAAQHSHCAVTIKVAPAVTQWSSAKASKARGLQPGAGYS